MIMLEHVRNIAGIPLLLRWRANPELLLTAIRINPVRPPNPCPAGRLPAAAAAQAAQLTSLLYGEMMSFSSRETGFLW